MNKNIFLTGGTGYIGSRLIPLLKANGFNITALARKGSEHKLPAGCNIITGDALIGSSYAESVKGNDIFIHLIGVSHPSPAKAEEFRSIDLVSIEEAVKAASAADIKQFIYLSVAEPAPVMKKYILVRKQGEKLLKDSGMNCVFIKPWYVLGPGHYWPYFFLPLYWLFKLIPPAAETASRLYPVKLKNVLNAILYYSLNPARGITGVQTSDLKNF